jgi:hypothetical protein
MKIGTYKNKTLKIDPQVLKISLINKTLTNGLPALAWLFLGCLAPWAVNHAP